MAPRGNKAAAGPEGGTLTLSQRDVKIIAIAWCCIKSVNNGKPVIDYGKFTAAAGYKTQDSARHIFPPLERKLLALAESFGVRPGDDSATTTTTTASGAVSDTASPSPAKGTRKRKLATGGNGDDDDEEGPDPDTPSKRRGKRLTAHTSLIETRRPGASVKREPRGDGGDGEEGEGDGGDDIWSEYADFVHRDGEA
ncbi:hypothetical protein F5B19DRAFT_494341 [Rostrohypoxylon terebratum]|nr:hypothetical protein F5B19DRAFT_494341 [Rostrohypoxylon terebratum]